MILQILHLPRAPPLTPAPIYQSRAKKTSKFQLLPKLFFAENLLKWIPKGVPAGGQNWRKCGKYVNQTTAPTKTKNKSVKMLQKWDPSTSKVSISLQRGCNFPVWQHLQQSVQNDSKMIPKMTSKSVDPSVERLLDPLEGG
jgi:hypothetical protein